MSSKQCSSNTSVKLQRRGSGTKDYSARENGEGGDCCRTPEEREQRHSARENGEGGDSLPKLQRRGSKDYSARENGKSGDSTATTLVYY